jgi:hypothetical protein
MATVYKCRFIYPEDVSFMAYRLIWLFGAGPFFQGIAGVRSSLPEIIRARSHPVVDDLIFG